MTVAATLESREAQYGAFENNSRVSQSIKEAFRSSKAWHMHRSDVRESLEMIANKLSRILSTPVEKADSWHDIAGYATLVEQRIIKEMTR
jgi:hypothetical protein